MENKTEIIEFVKKTTEAITVISESSRLSQENLGAIKEMIGQQNVNQAKSFEIVSGKMDGLLTMFKFVITPLVGGILGLVGVKLIFNLP